MQIEQRTKRQEVSRRLSANDFAPLNPAYFFGWSHARSEAATSNPASEACCSRPENIGVVAVVIPELSLSDIQRQVLAADLVIAANDGPLKQRPEALNRVRVDRTDNVLLLGVRDRAVREIVAQIHVAAMFVGGEQADLGVADHVDELLHVVVIGAVNDTGHNIALALHGANDSNLCALALLVLEVPVAVIAADVGFVHLQDRDGIPNRADRDRDGDGVQNYRDDRPNNPNRR